MPDVRICVANSESIVQGRNMGTPSAKAITQHTPKQDLVHVHATVNVEGFAGDISRTIGS